MYLLKGTGKKKKKRLWITPSHQGLNDFWNLIHSFCGEKTSNKFQQKDSLVKAEISGICSKISLCAVRVLMPNSSPCQTAPPSTLQLKFHNEGFIPLVQSSFSSKAIPPPPLVTDTQRAHNDHILSRGQNFRKKGWRPGECLVVKAQQINSNFHGGKCYRAPSSNSQMPKNSGLSWFPGPSNVWTNKAHKEFALKKSIAANALRGSQPSLAFSQMKKPMFREVPTRGHRASARTRTRNLLSPPWHHECRHAS